MGAPRDHPSERMRDVVGDIKRRATAGVRWVFLLNLASLPLSFLTNIMLGRISADALGYYGAIVVVISTYYTFFVLGGHLVFVRFTPAVPIRSRLGFLLTYASINLFIFGALALLASWLAPAPVTALLRRFGGPSSSLVVAAVLLASIVWGLSAYFLYGTLRPERAVATEKAVVVGFFLATAVAVGAWREAVAEDPSRFVWSTALWVYWAGAAVGIALLADSEELRQAAPLRWTLPRGFWPVVFDTHVSTIVNYAHQQLTPTLILLWMDVESLGHFQAALRYVLLLSFVPTTVASVLGPAMSRLEASGFRREGFGQVASAINAMLILLLPTVVGLSLLAGSAMAVFGPGFWDHRRALSLVAASALAGPVAQVGPAVVAAVGALRSYLVMSVIYVVCATCLSAILIPFLGLSGAALAVTAGSLVRQGTILIVLRRFGFPALPRLRAAWVCGFAATGISVFRDPVWPEAVLECIVLTLLFAWLGRVTPTEVRAGLQRLAARDSGRAVGDLPWGDRGNVR